MLALFLQKCYKCQKTQFFLTFKFTEIIFVDHQTEDRAYFKRRESQPIMATMNYGKTADTYGLWDRVGTDNAFPYQLLICDHSFYSGFFISGFTRNCFKFCHSWCGDTFSPYFRTASTSPSYKGVAFNINGHRPLDNRLVSVGVRWHEWYITTSLSVLTTTHSCVDHRLSLFTLLGFLRFEENFILASATITKIFHTVHVEIL